jgi:Domain of unknown function (DUF4436)
LKFGVVGLIVILVGAYIAAVVLYAQGGTLRQPPEAPAAGDRTTARLAVEDIQSNYRVVSANLTISPGPALLDPQTQHLNQDVTLRIRSAALPTRITWTRGMLPGVIAVQLTVVGEIEDWPFDRYRSGPIEVELHHGAGDVVVERVPVTFVAQLPGWNVFVSEDSGVGPYRVSLHRSLSAAAFGLVILGVLVAIAGLGLFVAIQTLRDRRPFQPPMTTWYAAMLFAVVPLRNALPGSPPFGGWVDITLVVWVLVVLVVSMLLYVACWWRHLKPHVEQPEEPAAAPSDS